METTGVIGIIIWGLYLGPAALAGLAAVPCPPRSCYLGCFLGFEDLVLSGLTERGQKWGPNCADDVPVRGAPARAPRTGTSAAPLGPTPFWLDWDQEGSKTQGEPSKMTLDMFL